MYAVNIENTEDLLTDYEVAIIEAQELVNKIDPEETPYTSKYEARTKLDEMCNKLEATKTVATLENKQYIIKEMGWRIASIKVKLGSIAWEVEENHHAQMDLDCAIEFYFPGFLDKINFMSGELTNQETKGEGDKDIDEESITIPVIELPAPNVYLDAMKCLNMLGILWAGRGHHRRSFMYFFSAKQFYTNAIQHITKKDSMTLESLYTHNLFYLAQAYGNIGNSMLSCRYCLETLARQHAEGLNDIAARVEWAKNCQGIR
jgi:hypothetical protein